jgi:electron transport complex protein RnfE
MGAIMGEDRLLILALGLCPLLAVSTTGMSGLWIGLVVAPVLLFSGVIVSLLRGIIPDRFKLACIVIITGTLTGMMDMFMRAFFPDMAGPMGIYLPLAAVNITVINRSFTFARNNTVINTALNSLGFGLFSIILLLLTGALRELLGSGAIFGMDIGLGSANNITMFRLAPGGFLVLGVLLALLKFLTRGASASGESLEWRDAQAKEDNEQTNVGEASQ